METGALKAVGVWFRSLDTGRYLYLLRNDAKHPGAWGLPGGKLEGTETLLGGMERECIEELGSFPTYLRLIHRKHRCCTKKNPAGRAGSCLT